MNTKYILRQKCGGLEGKSKCAKILQPGRVTWAGGVASRFIYFLVSFIVSPPSAVVFPPTTIRVPLTKRRGMVLVARVG